MSDVGYDIPNEPRLCKWDGQSRISNENGTILMRNNGISDIDDIWAWQLQRVLNFMSLQ